MALKDIKGQTFNDWLVIEQTGKDSRGNALWLCRCVCDKTHVVRGDHLQSGESRRCTKCARKSWHKGNRFEVFGASIAIWLDYPSKVCFVDVADFPLVKKYTWRARRVRPNDLEYAMSGKSLKMHCVIMGTPPEGKLVDHRDRDGLNNRRNNLRFATPAENARNRLGGYNKTQSQYKGVRRYSGKQLSFGAAICINYKNIYLGMFKTEEEAAEAYNNAAKKYFGEFASLNELKKDELILNQRVRP